MTKEEVIKMLGCNEKMADELLKTYNYITENMSIRQEFKVLMRKMWSKFMFWLVEWRLF